MIIILPSKYSFILVFMEMIILLSDWSKENNLVLNWKFILLGMNANYKKYEQ
jgi:hypothetical protein